MRESIRITDLLAMKKVGKLLALTFILMLRIQTLHAGSATWNLNPGSGDWNTATNWTPATVPNGAASAATFALSNTTGLSLSAFTEVNGVAFNAGANAFTITASPPFQLTISGVGITNNSGITQNFVNAVDGVSKGGGVVEFLNSATAGSLTAFTNNGGVVSGAAGTGILFYNTSTAENGTFTNNGGAVSGASGGLTVFANSSTAGNGTFTNNGGVVGANTGFTYFADSSTAGTATFINNGGAASGAGGGGTLFFGTSSAGNSVLIANGGLGGGEGGAIIFADDSTGTPRVEAFGNAILDISVHNPPGAMIGSLEGSGILFLGANNLTVGSNNLSTTFSGVIQDGGANGSFTKVGAGILTFEGGASNDHIADTVTLSIVNGSIVNLNFSGNADTVGGLIVDGVAQLPGLYGSAASGAPHQLPVFAGTGQIQVVLGGPPVITSPLTATGTVGQPFIYQFEASGATSVNVTNPPQGLTFNRALRAIVGNPATAGVFQVMLSATGNQGTTNATLTITVQPAPASGPVITSSTATTGRVGQPFSFRVYTTGGTPAARVSASGLPPGLVVDAVTGVTGLISGTPTTEGSSAVTVTVTDGPFTTSSILQLTFTADPALPVIVSPSSAPLTPGQFFSYTINAPSSGGPADPTIFTIIGDLPGGLTFNAATGTISGTYSPLLRENVQGGGPRRPELAGGALLASIQLFATNGHGTSTIPLLFLRPSSGVVNISTRLLIGTGENVLIGGFIITGNAPKVVIIRAIGPSTGIPGALQDPTLELHDSANHVVSNDNWKDTQEQIIRDTTIPPADNRESAIVVGLDPGSYTAIVAGKNGTTGIALVEVYDLGTASLDISGNARLAQISTRGFVDIGNNVMIGGFIISGQATRVIVRAIGPSLTASGVQGALPDTVLELRDGSGSLIFSNDDWRSTQAQEIIATGVPPTDDRESAIVANLVPGAYTAIVRGKGNTTGVALAEVYALQ